MMTRTFLRLALAAALPLALGACHTGTEAGDTNVEQGSAKKMETNHPEHLSNGDSLASGTSRDTTRHPTGKQLLEQSGKAVDRNHDGIAD